MSSENPTYLMSKSLEKAEIKVLDDFLKKNPTVEKNLKHTC